VAVAALCAAGTVAAGPVPTTGAGVCLPWPDTELASTSTQVENNGPAPVTITHVALVDPIGVTLEAAYLVPGSTPGFGGFPPVDAWDERIEAVGGQIPAGESYPLVLGLRQSAGSQPATLSGYEIAYTEAGRSHRLTMDWDIMITSDLDTCPGRDDA
jgi:hypothetical protein